MKALKLTLITIVFLFGTILTPRIAWAQNCAGVNYDDPSIVQIICPFIGVINALVLSAGAVFTGMIIISSYKYASSMGDPKGALGAKNSLTYAVVGVFGVIGVFVMLNILGGLLGADSSLIGTGIYGRIQQTFCDFLNNSTSSGGPIISGVSGC